MGENSVCIQGFQFSVFILAEKVYMTIPQFDKLFKMIFFQESHSWTTKVLVVLGILKNIFHA